VRDGTNSNGVTSLHILSHEEWQFKILVIINGISTKGVRFDSAVDYTKRSALETAQFGDHKCW
jgi:hypothetical protein